MKVFPSESDLLKGHRTRVWNEDVVQLKGKVVSVAAMVGAAAVLAAGSASAVKPIEWQSCEDLFNLVPGSIPADKGMQCAVVDAPLDYDDPDGPTTPIAVSKVAATSGTAKTAVFGNPGGPGSDALMFWANNEQSPAADPMYADSDLIAVQPRGLWGSNPIDCDPSAVGPLSLNRVHDACFGTDGAYVSTMTTENAARDMDFVRQSMGLDTIDYYGVSYGTKLGADYATLYPEHTGRMVLDSNVYPDGKWSEMSERTSLAQHARIYDMFDWIAANDAEYGLGDTPLKVYLNWKAVADQEVGGSPNLVPPKAQAGDLPGQLQGTPIEQPALGVVDAAAPALVRAEGAFNAITLRDYTNTAMTGIYDSTVGATVNEQAWPMVANMLSYYDKGGKIPHVSPVAAQKIRETKNGDNATFNTQGDMFTIVTCNEDATTQNPVGIAAAKIDGATGGDRLLAKAAGQGAGSDCLGYAPVAKPVQDSGDALTQKPLVIQNANDALTPIEGADEMARLMGAPMTVIPNGGHGAFRTGNKFIDEAVSNFLTAGTVPPATLPGRDAPTPLPKDLNTPYPSHLVGYDNGDGDILSALAQPAAAAAAAVAGTGQAMGADAGADTGAGAGAAGAAGAGAGDGAAASGDGAGQAAGTPSGDSSAQGNPAGGGDASRAADTSARALTPAERAARDAAAAVDQAATNLTGSPQSGAVDTVDRFVAR